MMVALTIKKADPTQPDTRALLQASHDLMRTLFPSEANHFLSVEGLCQPDVSFFSAKDGESTLGCAALANRGDYGELKSIFVDPDARGRGIAEALLQQIKAEAVRQNLPVLRLETGTGLDAAHRLYERHGFRDCGAFGTYEANAPFSRYMELTL